MYKNKTGRHLTKEHKRKISVANKGKKKSESHKMKMSLAQKGRKISEETKKKMSISHKKYFETHIHPALGKKLSSEHKKKISDTNKIVLKGKNKGKHNSLKTEFKKGQHGSPKTEFKKGHITWCKGLTKKDDKRLMRKKGKKSHMYGRKLSKEIKRKISEGNKLVRRKPEYRLKMSKKRTKEWKNPIIRERRISGVLKGLQIKPNKPEKFLIKLFKENNLPYNFVGDGKLIVEGKCPDFVNCNGQKKIIEMFGDYWHNLPNMKYNRTQKGTIEHYAKIGYKTLVIWEHELKDEENVLQKIKMFESK